MRPPRQYGANPYGQMPPMDPTVYAQALAPPTSQPFIPWGCVCIADGHDSARFPGGLTDRRAQRADSRREETPARRRFFRASSSRRAQLSSRPTALQEGKQTGTTA